MGKNIKYKHPKKYAHEWIPKSIHELKNLSDGVCYALIAGSVVTVLGVVLIFCLTH